MKSVDEIKSMLEEAERLRSIAEKAIAEKAASFSKDSEAYQVIKEMLVATAEENFVDESLIVQMLMKDFPVRKGRKRIKRRSKKGLDESSTVLDDGI